MSRSLVPPLPVSEKPRALAVEPAAVLVPLGLFVAVVSVAAPDGSYFPSSWGWASLAFLWAAAIGLVVQKRTTVAPLDVAYLGAWLVLLAWIAASALWSETTTQTMYEVERTLIYVSLAGALAVLARRSLPFLLPSLVAGIVAVTSYALATRLLPDRVGTFNSFAGYRLSEPLGYWNALSIFVAIGIVVAVGLAARAEAVVVRALSAASLVLLVPVLYFTFGRGGWLALASGLVAALIVDPRRLQLTTTFLVVAPWPGLAVWRAYESPTLTTQFSQFEGASHEGGRLAVTIGFLAVISAVVTAGLHGHCSPSHRRTWCPPYLRRCTRRRPRELCRCRHRCLWRPFRVGPTCARLHQAGVADHVRRSDEPPVQPLLQRPARYVEVGSR